MRFTQKMRRVSGKLTAEAVYGAGKDGDPHRYESIISDLRMALLGARPA